MKSDLMYQSEYESIEAELTELMEQHDAETITKQGRARAHALFKRLLQAYLAGQQGTEMEASEAIEEEEDLDANAA